MRNPSPIAPRFALSWLIVLLLPCVASGLDSGRAIRQLPHTWFENQLPQATVLSIVQRADGSMWLATYAGLAHYSGAEFEVVDQRSDPTLRSSAITALFEDAGQTLWVGTLNGGLYRSQGRKLEEVKLPAPIESVFGIAEGEVGALWLATNAGIARRDASGVKVFDAAQGFPAGPYRGLIADRQGGLWVGVDGTGVLHWRGEKAEMFGRDAGLPSAQVYALAQDHAGALWVGTQGGLVRRDNDHFVRDPRTAAIDGQRIYALEGDRDGNLWVVAQGGGLCRLTGERFECESGLAGLGNDIVRSMFEDREGSLWIGTTNNGVHKVSDSKLITITGELESNSVRAVFEDAAGTVWVGTDGGGLARYQDRVLQADPRNAQLPSPFMRSLCGDTAGNLWLGSIEGISRLGKDGTVRNFRVDDGLPAAIVFASTARHAGGVWAGTSRGLARVEGEQVSADATTAALDIRTLYEAPDGKLWLGLRSGLRCLKDGKLDTCGTDGLPNTTVFAFHPAYDGEIWLGTSRGLMRWRGGVLTIYGQNAGLYGEAVFSILDDASGHFWISSNRGIARIDRADLAALDSGAAKTIRPTWFGKSDGMLSSQANGASQSPAWRAHDGRLWIGTANGVVLIDPAHLRRNAQPPAVAIERVLVDGANLDAEKFQALGPGVDRLEFHYASMSYVAPEAVRYRYRLEGYDRDWVEAGDRREAYYTNLPPGDYRFQAVGSNNDGVWNEEGAGYAFRIQPLWFETMGFRVLLALLAAGFVFGMYRLRVWRVRANERDLMREVAIRTEALHAANAELSRLASLDGLTRIANRGAFDRSLRQAWDEHARKQKPLALLLCDLDEFKAYNDRYGHLAGDAALIRVAGELARATRSDADLAARYGGEELALLLDCCEQAQALAIAERLLQAVRELAIEHAASHVAPFVSVSIGVAVLVPDASQVPEWLVSLADEALYRAKAEGRHRACAAAGAPR